MSKAMKITASILVMLAILALLAVVVGKELGERKMRRQVKVAVAPLQASGATVRVEHGRYLYHTRGCADCHGANGGGREVMKSRAMLVRSPDISGAAASPTARYRMEDWVRIIRHGVKPDGTPALIMPSEDFNRMPDDDVAALVAYIGTLPPSAGLPAVIELPTMVKVMYAFGHVRDAAEIIDHSLPPAAPIRPEVSLAYGAYVAANCISCHGAGLSGGRIPGAPVEWPAPPNLTPGKGSVMTRYPSASAFQAMLRSGRRHDGSAISPVMPFASLSQLTDTDVRALHHYLRQLPPREAGNR